MICILLHVYVHVCRRGSGNTLVVVWLSSMQLYTGEEFTIVVVRMKTKLALLNF